MVSAIDCVRTWSRPAISTSRVKNGEKVAAKRRWRRPSELGVGPRFRPAGFNRKGGGDDLHAGFDFETTKLGATLWIFFLGPWAWVRGRHSPRIGATVLTGPGDPDRPAPVGSLDPWPSRLSGGGTERAPPILGRNPAMCKMFTPTRERTHTHAPTRARTMTDPEDSSHGGPSGVLGVMPRQPRSAISDQHQTRTLGLSPAGESRRPIEPESHVSLSAV